MKIGHYVLLVGLSLFVACGNPAQPPVVPPAGAATAILTASNLNPFVNSSVTFTANAAPADKVAKLELLEGTTVLKTVANVATLEQSVVMGVVGKRSFTARVTDSAGVIASSAVVEINTVSATLQAQPDVILVGKSIKLVPKLDSGNTGIAEVEFFEGIASLGKVSSAPFELVVNNFSTAGTREFKVVITDTNGLRIDAVVSVNVIPVELEKITDDSFNNQVQLLAPDILSLRAVYKSNSNTEGFDISTVWSIKKQDGSPAPIDGSFGTFQAIPGDSRGLLSFRVRYVPPLVIPEGNLRIIISAANLKNPSLSRDMNLLTILQKGTIESLLKVTFIGEGTFDVFTNRLTLRVGQSTEFTPFFIGRKGNTDGRIFFQVDAFSAIGTIECPVGCETASNLISSDKFKFTATQVGTVNVGIFSRHDLNLGTNAFIKVIP
jgi:hypothetical protein